MQPGLLRLGWGPEKATHPYPAEAIITVHYAVGPNLSATEEQASACQLRVSASLAAQVAVCCDRAFAWPVAQVRLWDVPSGVCLATHSFQKPIASLAFHCDGEQHLLAVASGHKVPVTDLRCLCAVCLSNSLACVQVQRSSVGAGPAANGVPDKVAAQCSGCVAKVVRPGGRLRAAVHVGVQAVWGQPSAGGVPEDAALAARGTLPPARRAAAAHRRGVGASGTLYLGICTMQIHPYSAPLLHSAEVLGTSRISECRVYSSNNSMRLARSCCSPRCRRSLTISPELGLLCPSCLRRPGLQ